MYHYAANNPIKYTDPDGRDHGIPNDIQKILDNRQKLNELRVIAKEIKATDMAGNRCIYLKYENAYTDGCFARACIIAEYLRSKGYTEYIERWLENFVKTRKTDYDGF